MFTLIFGVAIGYAVAKFNEKPEVFKKETFMKKVGKYFFTK